MSNLFASLDTCAGALGVYQQSLDVVQNNVTNASTPGYARQQLPLEAQPFDPQGGLPGGVAAGELESARDRFADEQVRQQLQSLGAAESRSAVLERLQSSFDVTGQSGIGKSLNDLFNAFSAWSIAPDDPSARQNVLTAAGNFAVAVQQAASGISQSATNTGQQIGSTVTQINDLAARLADLNRIRSQSPTPDPGLDAQRTSLLEQLSELTDVTAAQQDDGTMTVLLGGQTPLVIGNHAFAIHAGPAAPTPEDVNPNAPPPVAVFDAQGNDVTSEVDSGQLGGLLDVRNRVIGGLIGDPSRQGGLNQLAQAVADQVNQLLTGGQTAAGTAGVPLFTYDSGSPTDVARTLALSSSATPDQLAAADAGPPPRSNGVALDLAALANTAGLQGETFSQFYGALASGIGQETSNAQDALSLGQQQVAQAKSLRDQISGVSLDAEAVSLMEFQHAYEATSHVIQVLDQLTETTIKMVING